ncbi:hypothetical protein L6R49_03980 [Myxococcota bacterium]|nr:hypothetical protein [Myxococcota bacterium]
MRWPQALAALGLGVALWLPVMGPGITQLSARLPVRENDDTNGAIYLHHAFHDAVLEGRLSLRDPDQLLPAGYDRLRADGGNSVEMIVSGLLRLVLPWPTWFSVAHLIWIPLNLLAFLPLGLHLWGRLGPSLAAGAAWSVLGPTLGQIEASRLTQVALFALPLAALGLLRVAEEGGRRAIVLAGVGVALLGLSYWFYGLFLALVAPGFLAWGLTRRPGRALVEDYARAAAICLGVLAPALLAIAWPSLTGGWAPGAILSSEWASPVFPDALQLSGAQERHVRGALPWVTLPGVAWSLWRGERRALWLGLTALCFVFAMGPAQDLGGQRWLLPYYPIWRFVPGFDRMNHPERWLALGGMFLIVLAADGAARTKPWLVWLLPLGVLAQSQAAGVTPLPTWAFHAPEHWRAVAEGPPGGVITLPLGQASRACAYQHVHGRALLGGMVEGLPPMLPPAHVAFVEGNGLLTQLLSLSRGQDAALDLRQDDLDALRAAGLSMVVLDNPSAQRARRLGGIDLKGRLSAAFGPPVVEGADGALWHLPETGAPGAAPTAGVKLIELGPAGPPPTAAEQGPAASGPPRGPPQGAPQGPPQGSPQPSRLGPPPPNPPGASP